MRYFKHSEVVRIYGVSDKTVRNWIDAAQASKNDLDVVLVKGRPFLADTLHNEETISRLVNKNKKFRNTRSSTVIRPTKDFHDNFTLEERSKIIRSLLTKRQLPFRSRYIGQLAKLWSEYLLKLRDSEVGTYLSGSINYMSLLRHYLSTENNVKTSWNVIDVNCANALSSVEFVKNLSRNKQLGLYVAVDVSPSLTNMSVQTLNGVNCTETTLDIELESVERILDSHAQALVQRPNHFLLLGGTVTNYNDPLMVIKHISGSMKTTDLLTITLKLDSAKSRSFFDFNGKHVLSELSSHDEHFLKMLGFKKDDYTVYQKYDVLSRERHIYIEPSKNIEVIFGNDSQSKVEFRAKEQLMLLRIHHWTEAEFLKIISDAGLTVVHSSLLQNEGFMGVTCKKL